MKKEQPIEMKREEKEITFELKNSFENCEKCEQKFIGDNIRIMLCKKHIEMLNNG